MKGLQQTLTADGKSDEFTANGSFRVSATGTFGGGSLTLEEDLRGDDSWTTVDRTADTADVGYIVDGLVVSRYRFDLTGATSPSITITTKGGKGAS